MNNMTDCIDKEVFNPFHLLYDNSCSGFLLKDYNPLQVQENYDFINSIVFLINDSIYDWRSQRWEYCPIIKKGWLEDISA